MAHTDICTRLTNDPNSIESSEQMTSNPPDRMSRREKKMHERWLTSSKADSPTSEASTKKILLGVEFPPIAVLRRKFSSKSTGPPPAVNEVRSSSLQEIEQGHSSESHLPSPEDSV